MSATPRHVYFVMRHVHYECGDAVGAALTLEAAKLMARADAIKCGAIQSDAQLDWSRTDETKGTWGGWPCPDPGCSWEVRRFELVTP